MPQFIPSDRETVRERVLESDFVHKASPAGPGLIVVKEADSSDEGTVNTFTNLMEKHGWYAASVSYHADGSRHVLMPVTEVPDEA